MDELFPPPPPIHIPRRPSAESRKERSGEHAWFGVAAWLDEKDGNIENVRITALTTIPSETSSNA